MELWSPPQASLENMTEEELYDYLGVDHNESEAMAALTRLIAGSVESDHILAAYSESEEVWASTFGGELAIPPPLGRTPSLELWLDWVQ